MSTITYNDTIIPSATDASVLSEKVDVKLGANLLNVDDPNQRVGWAISSQGTIFQDTVNHYTDNCCVTDYIPVEASTAYHLSSKSGGLCNNYSICFYNKNKVWIGGQSLREEVGTGTNVFVEVTDITTPEGCAYIRTTYCTLVTIYGNPTTKAKRENIMINKGGAVPYEPYSIIGGYLVRSDVQNKDYTNSLTFLPYPARTDGTTNPSSWYAGYTVPLDGLYEAGYRSVKFRASTFTNWGVLAGGIIYAGDEMECNTRDQEKEWDCTWFTLPITENSTKLVASYGKTDQTGETVHHITFAPEVVYFETRGMFIDYSFPETFMPSKIYGIIGEPLQIFHRSVVADINPYNWYHNYTCENQGRVYARYFEITPEKVENQIPELTITHSLKDANLNASTGKTSSLVLIEKPLTAPSSNKNVLCIGASTTAGGQWASELKRMLTGDNDYVLNTGDTYTVSEGTVYTIETSAEVNPIATVTIKKDSISSYSIYVSSNKPLPDSGTLTKTSGTGPDSIWYTSIKSEFLPNGDKLGNISFVGRKNGTVPNDCPVSIKVEATPGWRWKYFYSYGGEEPFPVSKITGLPDFTNYASQYCNSQIDVAIFLMGTNNERIFSEGDLTGEGTEPGKGGVIENMKFLLNGLHHDYPNCQVIVGTGCGFSAYMGEEYSYSPDDPHKTADMLYWNRRYSQEVDKAITELNGTGTPWCFMANTVLESDSENIFPKEEKAVNLRMPDVKETIDTNGVHPELVGYQMVADSFYRCFVNTILN